jgi:hypothetical protein
MLVVTSLSSRSAPLAFTAPQSGFAAQAFRHAVRQSGCADNRTIFVDTQHRSAVGETRFADSKMRFVNDELKFTARVFSFCTTKPAWLITSPDLCDNETMTVYIVQKLHWEYQDCFYGVETDSPVKAFMSAHDAEEYRKRLEHVAQLHWEKHDAESQGNHWSEARTPEGNLVREQPFYQVIEVECEP